jgi:hypothetical protein
MNHAAVAALLVLLLIPVQAQALDTSELLGLVAMPLAVAAVSEATDVPATELSHLVATLNQARVPPTQFVQVIRYAPAAIVVETEQPTFVQYVDQQVASGVTGTQLVTVIEQRLPAYQVQPQFVAITEPAPVFVMSPDYIVTTARQPVIADTNDLLAFIAMPLAVAAVSEVSGIPLNDLSMLVSSLNAADVPPLQFIEVVRYAPVALVSDGDPFVSFVQTQVNDGVTGMRLVQVIEDRLETYNVSPQVVSVPVRVVEVNDNFLPSVVTTRIAERRDHPHGGPPGQVKKEIGVQTGAEVVHGRKPGRTRDTDRRVVVDERRARRAPERVTIERRENTPPKRDRVVMQPRPEGGRGGPKIDAPKQPHGGNNPGKGRGQGQGKAKGKGKD